LILIITNKSDIHCNPVIEHLKKNNDQFFRLNTDSLLDDYEISFSVKNNRPELEISNKFNSKTCVASRVKSVWERRPSSPNVNELLDPIAGNVLKEESLELSKWLRYLFIESRNVGSALWDRPNESKLRQYFVASKIIKDKKINISIPDTKISNKRSDILEIAKTHSYLSVKPIGSDSIELDEKFEIPFVSRRIHSNQISNISTQDIQTCPTFLQNYIPKQHELRVTVVGSKSYCCKIDSQLLPEGAGKEDWREGYDIGLSQTWEVTPDEIEEFCQLYLKLINSSFGCFDFIYDKKGNYHFLECNPNGQWMWMEIDIGIPISKGIADYLSHRTN